MPSGILQVKPQCEHGALINGTNNSCRATQVEDTANKAMTVGQVPANFRRGAQPAR